MSFAFALRVLVRGDPFEHVLGDLPEIGRIVLYDLGGGLVPGEVGLFEVFVDRGCYVHLHDCVALGSFSQGNGFDYDSFEHGIEVGDKLADRRRLGAHLLGFGDVGFYRRGFDDSSFSGHGVSPFRGGSV